MAIKDLASSAGGAKLDIFSPPHEKCCIDQEQKEMGFQQVSRLVTRRSKPVHSRTQN
jgi:hypothetical protein